MGKPEGVEGGMDYILLIWHFNILDWSQNKPYVKGKVAWAQHCWSSQKRRGPWQIIAVDQIQNKGQIKVLRDSGQHNFVVSPPHTHIFEGKHWYKKAVVQCWRGVYWRMGLRQASHWPWPVFVAEEVPLCWAPQDNVHLASLVQQLEINDCQGCDLTFRWHKTILDLREFLACRETRENAK